LHLCYSARVTVVGLRELRQQASELVRRVEAGEEVTITVAGRPSVRMVRVAPRAWRPYSAVAEVFDGPEDAEWERDRARIDDELHNRWGPG
jgi:prevent-host-death family protein